MKSSWIQSALAMVCVVTAGTHLTMDRAAAQSLTQSKETTAGDGDDPQARDHWEWLRLHDPATGQVPPGMRQKELSFARSLPKRGALAPKGVIKGKRTLGLAPSDWARRGPWNVGGRTRALAVDVSNAGTILAGGFSVGRGGSHDSRAPWFIKTALSDSPN